MNEGSLTKGSVFDVQRFSIHDGPGIRTTVFLKGCPLDCFWCQNPESKRSAPEIFFYKEKCTNCGTCAVCCPSGASTIINNTSAIDREKCTGCGRCAEVCPNQARKLTGSYMTVNEVLEIVIRDKSFYENSRGGMTISGGEPFLQCDFAGEILRESKQMGESKYDRLDKEPVCLEVQEEKHLKMLRSIVD